MRVIIEKRGNGASVRIPADVMHSARLDLNDAVDVREEDGRIIIEAIRSDEYVLSELLAGITPENLHAAVDVGAPVGKEML